MVSWRMKCRRSWGVEDRVVVVDGGGEATADSGGDCNHCAIYLSSMKKTCH